MPYYVYKHKAKNKDKNNCCLSVHDVLRVSEWGFFYLHSVNPMINKTEPGTSLNAIKTTHNTC